MVTVVTPWGALGVPGVTGEHWGDWEALQAQGAELRGCLRGTLVPTIPEFELMEGRWEEAKGQPWGRRSGLGIDVPDTDSGLGSIPDFNPQPALAGLGEQIPVPSLSHPIPAGTAVSHWGHIQGTLGVAFIHCFIGN